MARTTMPKPPAVTPLPPDPVMMALLTRINAGISDLTERVTAMERGMPATEAALALFLTRLDRPDLERDRRQDNRLVMRLAPVLVRTTGVLERLERLMPTMAASISDVGEKTRAEIEATADQARRRMGMIETQGTERIQEFWNATLRSLEEMEGVAQIESDIRLKLLREWMKGMAQAAGKRMGEASAQAANSVTAVVEASKAGALEAVESVKTETHEAIAALRTAMQEEATAMKATAKAANQAQEAMTGSVISLETSMAALRHVGPAMIQENETRALKISRYVVLVHTALLVLVGLAVAGAWKMGWVR